MTIISSPAMWTLIVASHRAITASASGPGSFCLASLGKVVLNLP